MQKRVTNPVQQTFPIILADKNDRERLDLARLDKGDRFEQLVKSPESARQDYECDRVLHEHHFSYEEIAKIEKLVRVNVRFLLQRQFNIQTNRSSPCFSNAF